MPTTTTLKLPEELKERIAPLARRAGKTPHAWMLEALEREAALCELREGFLQAGQQSAQEVDAGGPLYAAEDVHSYLLARVSGKPARRPAPLKRARRH
ncbi:MAG: hypothetical protein HY901_09425 [Deltaproteobacteria bacterium]|nr:hypothetical protein [Deltaproteobacteria bacterium]